MYEKVFTLYLFYYQILIWIISIQNNLYNDTIIERKKETREEYQKRIQKQLFGNDDDLYQKSIISMNQKKVKKNLSKWRKIHPFIRFFIIGL